MPIRLMSHADLELNGELIFCYLCGSRLASGATNRDHIVPKALFTSAPDQGNWRPILSVHEQCHAQKNRSDDLAALWEKMQTQPADDWPRSEYLQKLKLEPIIEHDSASGKLLYAFRGVAPLAIATHDWLRGCYSLVYGKYMPPAAPRLPIHTLSPFPGYTKDWTLDDDIAVRGYMTKLISHAESTDQWDGIEAWNTALRFRCIWMPKHKCDSVHRFVAWMWLPRIGEYQHSEHWQEPFPWVWVGHTVARPAGAVLFVFPG